MLGRKDYTQAEIDQARATVAGQLAAYRKLVKSVAAHPTDPKITAAREDFEWRFFNNLTLVLDRFFVHRIRPATGKDTNPLNEVELITEGLLNGGGVMQGNKVIKYVPEQAVVQLKIGDPIRLTEKDFDRLSKAFFADLETKFL